MIHVRFINSGVPYSLGFSAGEFGTILDIKQAKHLESIGVVEILKDYNELPDDIPGKEALIQAGIQTVEQLKSIELTEIEGISKALAKKIIQYIG